MKDRDENERKGKSPSPLPSLISFHLGEREGSIAPLVPGACALFRPFKTTELIWKKIYRAHRGERLRRKQAERWSTSAPIPSRPLFRLFFTSLRLFPFFSFFSHCPLPPLKATYPPRNLGFDIKAKILVQVTRVGAKCRTRFSSLSWGKTLSFGFQLSHSSRRGWTPKNSAISFPAPPERRELWSYNGQYAALSRMKREFAQK